MNKILGRFCRTIGLEKDDRQVIVPSLIMIVFVLLLFLGAVALGHWFGNY